MVLPASCSDSWLVELVDLSRQRLAVIGLELGMLTVTSAALVAETRWESDAARGFRADADDVDAQVRRLTERIELLRDDLAAIRTTLPAVLWGCG